MSLVIQTQSVHGGSFTTLDLSTTRLADPKLQVSVSHPVTLTFTALHPQHTLPLAIGTFLRVFDDVEQSESAPAFEGFVEQASPGSDANEVLYTAYDPTYRCAAMFPIMSEDWDAGSPPTEGANSFARRVYNVTIDNDDDYAYSQADGLTCGEILKDLFDSHYEAMAWFNAANESSGKAYVQSDLDALTYKPQEKVVAEGESVRSFVERLLQQYDPAYRLLFVPGTREWRIQSLATASESELTLGDSTVDDVVLSMELHASREGRWTAVKIYGPKSLTQVTPQVTTGGLSVVASGHFLQTAIATGIDVEGQNAWQITDADKRRVSRRLAEPRSVQLTDYNIAETISPYLEGYWEETSGGQAGWRPIPNWVYNQRTGIISIPWGYAYRYNPDPASGEAMYENPIDVRLIYAYPNNVLSVRYPTSGFSGTAYDVDGLENELRLYDEMLAVGFERGTPVVSATREAQFAILAEKIQAMRRDIVYTGGCMLDGCRYDWLSLFKRINFGAIDADGATLTTGWEGIKAFLTDVEMNFADQTTSLTFSGDQLEMIGMDPELMKKRLNVRALHLETYFASGFNTVLRNRRFGDKTGFHFAGDTLETLMWTRQGSYYADEFGNTESFDPTALG